MVDAVVRNPNQQDHINDVEEEDEDEDDDDDLDYGVENVD